MMEHPEATPTMRALARHRALETARPWLTVLIPAWLVGLMASGNLKIVAWLVLAVAFFKLYGALPFGRNAKAALGWCATVSIASALYEISPVELDAGSGAAVAYTLVFIVVVTGSIVAFTMAMRELARLAKSRASMEQWRSVQRWQLVGFAVAALVFGAMGSLATPTQTYESSSPLAFFVALCAAGGLVATFIVYPILAILRLQRHLQERFSLWGLVERGELVLRDDAATASRPSAAAAPPPAAEAP